MFIDIRKILSRKTGVSRQSKLALEKARFNLNGNRKKVLDILGEMGIATNDQIAQELGWDIQCVTPRVHELKLMGFIDVAGVGKSKKGNSAKKWRVSDPNDHNLLKIA